MLLWLHGENYVVATLCVWLATHKPADAACLYAGILVKMGEFLSAKYLTF